jgi:hypothetical protein
MMSVPAAPVRTVVLRVSNVVVDRVEVRAEVSAEVSAEVEVTAQVSAEVRGARSAAVITVPEGGQIVRASVVARC